MKSNELTEAQANNMSQSDIARYLGVSRQYVSDKIRRGYTKYEILCKVNHQITSGRVYTYKGYTGTVNELVSLTGDSYGTIYYRMMHEGTVETRTLHTLDECTGTIKDIASALGLSYNQVRYKLHHNTKPKAQYKLGDFVGTVDELVQQTHHSRSYIYTYAVRL